MGRQPHDPLGRTLVAGRRRIDQQEAHWFRDLVEFDRGGGWALDGQLSCAAWLQQWCGMSYATAHEKLRVAHELRRRPLIAQAHTNGELSYSKVRAMTRIVDVDEETDRILLMLARTGTAADLALAARHQQLVHDQHKPPNDLARYRRRGLRRAGYWDGMATTEIVLPAEDQERLFNILDAYLQRRHDQARPVDNSPAGEPPDGSGPPVDESSAGDTAAIEDPAARTNWSQQRADALIELLEIALAHHATTGAINPDRTTVSVVVDYDTLVERTGRTAELAGGAPLSGEAARRLACDAGLTRIITRGQSEILDVGRQTRHWTNAQRRAIHHRHHGRCAFPACQRRILHIHHTTPWADHGLTNLDAGVPLCSAHHHLVHEGQWTVMYHGPTATLVFTGPQGQTIETTLATRPTLAA